MTPYSYIGVAIEFKCKEIYVQLQVWCAADISLITAQYKEFMIQNEFDQT